MRYVLLIFVLILTAGCSRPDFDTAVQVEAWLESLDPNAEVIEVWCTGNVEQPPGSGTWAEWPYRTKVSASEALAAARNQGLDWNGIVALMISSTRTYYSSFALEDVYKNLSPMARMMLRMNFRVEDLRCDGKELRSPRIQIGKCPNDIDGCDEPPMATDLPPLPPPSPGGGDF